MNHHVIALQVQVVQVVALYYVRVGRALSSSSEVQPSPQVVLVLKICLNQCPTDRGAGDKVCVLSNSHFISWLNL